jgi:exodeoxyribonuclease-3
MAFRRKAAFILTQKPDILIVPECEHPDKLLFPTDTAKPTDSLWFGTNKNKGLAIFSYSSYRFRVLDRHNKKLQLVIPIAVTGGPYDFNLFAIWAHNPMDPDGPYVEQVWKAVHYYRSLLNGTKTILAGDFNSNKIWDRKRRQGNHSHVVKFLEAKGISSTYHLHHKQMQGTEEHATLYLYRHEDKPYHIDYCFASGDMTKKIRSVEIGDYEFWTKYSDHVPLMVTFEDL